MGFSRRPFRAPASPRSKGSVLAVGRRVYIAPSAGDRATTPVMLTDDAGHSPLASLSDGTEVAIVAWRPGWAGGTRYRVRATHSGIEGWLPAGNLRTTETALPPPAIVPPPVAESGRPFGRRG